MSILSTEGLFLKMLKCLITFPYFFLGLDAELYYVRNDLISHYALSFNLLVPSETNFLHFTWHAKSKVRELSADVMTVSPRPQRQGLYLISGLSFLQKG